MVAGVGNGLILGWMMWKSRLVPRDSSWLGLVAVTSLLAAGVAVMLGWIEAGSTWQVDVLATLGSHMRFQYVFRKFGALAREYGDQPAYIRRRDERAVGRGMHRRLSERGARCWRRSSAGPERGLRSVDCRLPVPGPEPGLP
ncbi:hypothetical protein HKCCE3408_19055 [Rhodobacterales bacterium HKCCE3408]|nr:hypothetical protein [Rhodobacterales bacterium HKCCE3408]